MSEKTIVFLGLIEAGVIIAILVLSIITLAEVKRDPYDVNNDGVANIVDLSVLAAEVNERGK